MTSTIQTNSEIDDADAELQALVQYASEICEMPISFVSEVGPRVQDIRAKVGIEVTQTPIELSFCIYTVRGDGLLEVPDTTQDERFRDHPFVTGPAHLRFYAGVPIVSPTGSNIGSFCVMDRQPRALTNLQRQTLAMLARQVELRLELAQARDRLQGQESERKSASKDALAQMARLTDGLPVGVAQVDRRYRFRFVNDTLARMLGTNSEAAFGKAIAESAGEVVSAALKESIDRSLAGKTVEEEIQIGDMRLRLRAIKDADSGGMARGVMLQLSPI